MSAGPGTGTGRGGGGGSAARGGGPARPGLRGQPGRGGEPRGRAGSVARWPCPAKALPLGLAVACGLWELKPFLARGTAGGGGRARSACPAQV